MEDRLECTVLTNFAELEAIHAEWTRLQRATGKCEIFQHFDWIAAWWQSFGKDCRLFTPIVLRQGQIVGILPLVLAGRRLRFLGYSVSDYNHFLAEPSEGNAALEICFNTLRLHARDWDEILLENVPESSLLVACIQTLPKRWRSSIVGLPADPCPTMLLVNNKQEVLESSMSKLKSVAKRLKRQGPLTFKHIEDVSEVVVHLPQFFKQHIDRSTIAGRQSAFLDRNYVSFYKHLLERLDAKKEIRFSVLQLGGRTVAYHFGFLYAGTYLFYKPSFDVDFWELSPGQGILWYIFEYLQTIDVQEFDFGRGDESYKHRFSNHVRQNLIFTVYPSGCRSTVLRAFRLIGESTKELIRKSSTLERVVKAVRGKWQDTRLSYRREGARAALRKLFGILVLNKDESWVVSVDSSSRSVQGQRRFSINEISLSGLADLAATFPDMLTEHIMLRARELLRQKNTAWIISIDESEHTLVWTSVSSELTISTNRFPLSEKAMVILEIWPLTLPRTRHNFVAILRQFAFVADAMGLTTWAVCPKRFLPSERVLRDWGVTPKYRWVRTQILGKAHWKRQEFD